MLAARGSLIHRLLLHRPLTYRRWHSVRAGQAVSIVWMNRLCYFPDRNLLRGPRNVSSHPTRRADNLDAGLQLRLFSLGSGRPLREIAFDNHEN